MLVFAAVAIAAFCAGWVWGDAWRINRMWQETFEPKGPRGAA